MWDRLLVAAYSRTPDRPRRTVVRLLSPGYRVGALAVVVRPDGRVLLVDQPYVRGWSLPGGDLKRGEEAHEGLARELREEVGLQVALPPLTRACLRTSDRWVTFVHRLDVDDAAADGVHARSAELSALAWFAPDALPPVHHDAVEPLRLARVATPRPDAPSSSGSGRTPRSARRRR